MPKVQQALINFIDGSYLYVELSRKVDATDLALVCFKVVGLPDGAPTDKPSIASSVVRTATAGNCVEMVIPLSRINCISIQEEFLGKSVPSDMKNMWT